MASVLNELVEILRDEKECYEGILTLIKYKQESLIAKDTTKINQITMREEEFLGRAFLLKDKRIKKIQDMSVFLSVKKEDVTLDRLCSIFSNDIELGNTAKQLKKDILDLMEEIKKVNMVNKKLIEQNLEVINFSINAIASIIKGPEFSYLKNGNGNCMDNGSFFETKG